MAWMYILCSHFIQFSLLGNRDLWAFVKNKCKNSIVAFVDVAEEENVIINIKKSLNNIPDSE